MSWFRKIIVFPISFTFIFIFLFSTEGKKYSLQEAKKVYDLIDKITIEQAEGETKGLRSVVVTESEFNSYVAYRIEAEEEEIMKELIIRMYEQNKIEGKIFIDLRGQKIPKLLRPQMNLYFRARLLIDKNKAKIKIAIENLYLEKQHIPVWILDLIIKISASIDNEKATSINDWYDLPYGIKNVVGQKGKAVIYY